MYFEVFIPSANAQDFDVSITVAADNWMAALKSGLQRTGEVGDVPRNLMCDIKDDNSIHVTDATSRRVFVLRELSAQEFERSQSSAPAGADASVSMPTEILPKVEGPASDVQPKPAAQAATPAPSAQPKAEPKPTVQAATPAPSAQPKPAAQATTPAPSAQPKPEQQPQPRVERAPQAAAQPATQPRTEPAPDPRPAPRADVTPETHARNDAGARPAPAARVEPKPQPKHAYEPEDARMRIGSATHEALQTEEDQAQVLQERRSKSDVNRVVDLGRRDEKVSEFLIEDIFLEIQEIHEGGKSMEEVVNFVMDMAMDKIGAESGSILFADVNGRELYFATARGPKAGAVMDFRVPMGQGIVGFCTREGVSLAISDVNNDPRFYKEISESLGYQTYGLLCAPIQHEGRVYGAIEVMNKKNRDGFSADETNALAYIGRQLAQYVHDEIMRNTKIN